MRMGIRLRRCDLYDPQSKLQAEKIKKKARTAK
jgi:hypothetical protein